MAVTAQLFMARQPLKVLKYYKNESVKVISPLNQQLWTPLDYAMLGDKDALVFSL